jgi:hypothetical protein
MSSSFEASEILFDSSDNCFSLAEYASFPERTVFFNSSSFLRSTLAASEFLPCSLTTSFSVFLLAYRHHHSLKFPFPCPAFPF